MRHLCRLRSGKYSGTQKHAQLDSKAIYVPGSTVKNDESNLNSDRSVLTDQPVPKNQILVIKISRQTTVIDMAITNINNLQNKHNC